MNKNFAMITTLAALFLSDYLFCLYLLNKENFHNISFLVITWIVAIVLLIPVFMLISLLLTCLIGLVISIIYQNYLFKRLYLTVVVFNSLQLLINTFLIVFNQNKKISVSFIFSWSFLWGMSMIFLFRKMLIDYVKVSKFAANVVAILGIVLSAGSLVIGVVHL
ncbi:MAG: hypothetical protein LBF82_01385 [Lactobacillales bacterium]|jgi:hypothetical protein|nr:hypothetical protein [Lactobacillales bacterium]